MLGKGFDPKSDAKIKNSLTKYDILNKNFSNKKAEASDTEASAIIIV